MLLEILRLETGPEGTFGVLRVDGKCFCCTLELPWKNNGTEVSCVPAGEYATKWWDSHKFGRTLMLQAVPGREAILIHQGNTTEDIRGCILVGWRYGAIPIKGQVNKFKRGLFDSLGALGTLLLALRKDESPRVKTVWLCPSPETAQN